MATTRTTCSPRGQVVPITASTAEGVRRRVEETRLSPSSSRPGSYHPVKLYSDGALSCPCESSQLGRRVCRHMRAVFPQAAHQLDRAHSLDAQEARSRYAEAPDRHERFARSLSTADLVTYSAALVEELARRAAEGGRHP